MGHVRRRKLEGGGTAYLARYRGPDGRERSKQFAKRGDAERFLSVAEVTKAEGSWVDPARGRMCLRDWLVRFQESERLALRPSTLARDEVYVRTQILPAFGDVALARIEHQAIQTLGERARRTARADDGSQVPSDPAKDTRGSRQKPAAGAKPLRRGPAAQGPSRGDAVHWSG
jgi:Phage integrase, N-terminal SAM-like domain